MSTPRKIVSRPNTGTKPGSTAPAGPGLPEPLSRRLAFVACCLALMPLQLSAQPPQLSVQPPRLPAQPPRPSRNYTGFDRNLYPGDSRLAELRQHFAFTGFWLNNPPGEKSNSWSGHREILKRAGFGFLVLFNGRLIADIHAAGISPETLARKDAAEAIAAARREGFPARTVLFLDVEEGGRLEPGQAAYLFSWTEALAASPYLPGAYLSGQPAPDGPGKTITSAQDVQTHVATQHLHPIVLWVAQDACPPAPGCVAQPPALSASGTPGAAVWQYAQSPRRRNLTQSCAQTYAADGNCYAPANNDLFLDLNVAATPDPSHGR